MARTGKEYWRIITVWLRARGVPSLSRTIAHDPRCASTVVARRTTARVKHESDMERPLKQRHVQGCQGETPEPGLQPRNRGWPWPLDGQGPDWTDLHLYAPCYTARYLMFCQSPQTKTFAAVLAHRFPTAIPSQSPMVPRCALPPRPRPSLGEPAALAEWASCIQIAWWSPGGAGQARRSRPPPAPPRRQASPHRCSADSRGTLPPEVSWQRSPRLTSSIAAACSSLSPRTGPKWRSLGWSRMQASSSRRPWPWLDR